jgi:hypothetical protein
VEVPAPEPTPVPAPAPTPEPVATPEPIPEVVPAPETEPKKKGFLKLPFFHRKPKEESIETEKASDVAEQLTNESLLRMIDDKLHKVNGDEFILVKISKKGLLILLGLGLLFLWLSPLIELNLPEVLNSRYKLLNIMRGQNPSPTPEASISPTPVPVTGASIRVRMGSNSLEAANEVKDLLLAAGFNRVDMVYDPQVNPKSLLIVTKQTDETLQQTLKQVFDQKYMVASEAAELTSDSDYDASILVGEAAKISP